MDPSTLVVKRAEAHNRIFEVLESHATGDTAKRVRTARGVYNFGRLEGLLEGYILAEEVRALAEIVEDLATPKKSKAK
jgi:hypothetical protein